MELIDLRQVRAETGLKYDALHWLIKKGAVEVYQPGGPKGKLYVSRAELKRLLQPREAK
jgi:hypothetical protein